MAQAKYLQIDGRLIRFKTKDGLLLDGFLTRARKPSTCLIYIHGMTSNFYRGMRQFAIAKRLARLNIPVFAINTRGHDLTSMTSRTKISKPYLIAGTDLERFEDCVYDIGGAIKILKSIGFRKFILSGQSTGCQKITYYQYKAKDRSVMGLILLGPASDYEWQKHRLKGRFNLTVNQAKRKVRNRQGNVMSRDTDYFSAKRFLSVADLRNVEARLFDYEGPMREFGAVKVPVLAVFGSREEFAYKPIKTYMQILENKSGSRLFVHKIIRGATHTFIKHENDVAAEVQKFVQQLV